MMSEVYYAVKIGRVRPYFAVDNRLAPKLFTTLDGARLERKAILRTCGHKDVFAVRVVLTQAKVGEGS